MQGRRGQSGRRQRYPVQIDAVVFRSDDRRIPVTLTDFSDQGCRIESDADFRVGEKFQIALERMGMVKAQVRWTTPGVTGTRFLTESDF